MCLYQTTYMCVRQRLRRRLCPRFDGLSNNVSGRRVSTWVALHTHQKESESREKGGEASYCSQVYHGVVGRAKGSLASTKVTRERVLARWEQRRCRADRQLGVSGHVVGDGSSQQSRGVFGSRVAACGDLRGWVYVCVYCM